MFQPRLVSYTYKSTSHMRLKARYHCILRSFIGRKGRNCLSSFHIGRWRSKGPTNFHVWWNVHGFLHDRVWIMSCGLLEFVSCPPPRSRLNANPNKPCQWYGLWVRIKGPRNYMGHGPWLMCVMILVGEHMVFVGIKIAILVKRLYLVDMSRWGNYFVTKNYLGQYCTKPHWY